MYKIAKKILKAILLTLLVLGLLLVISGFIIYTDATRLANAMKGNKTALYRMDGKLIAGIRLEQAEDFLNQDGATKYYTEQKLRHAIEEAEDSELILIFSNESLSAEQTINVNDMIILLNKPKITEIMKADSSEYIIRVLVSDLNMTEMQKNITLAYASTQYTDKQQLKNAIFAALLTENIKNKGIKYILEEVKQGRIEVKPEFISLKIAGYLPSGFIDSALGSPTEI